ncbi:Protein of unknown function (DUF668 [Striga hermonthica]|uniref:DUF668 domain-containing protein n=1 Tax=Striga hermonthica TaxID=68872 RepID=A0A9N7RJZ2_STRHE|nr:Protein of unknown function (DUF668 [Striga hermonthica]
MGARFSKQSSKPNPYAAARFTAHQEDNHLQNDNCSNEISVAPTAVTQSIENPIASTVDEFYDGIPQYQRSWYQKSRSFRATKVLEVSARLTRAGSAGLGKAAGVLDTLGISVGGFIPRTTAKSSELSILSFEVANTIVKGSNLMESLSDKSIRRLKEVVFPAEGVQKLISNDMDELLRIVASDKREELKVFSDEVVRFGNRCKDPQWHDLDRFFEKRNRDRTPQKQLRETAESLMLQLITSVHLTAELYRELHALDRFEQDYQLKRLEELRYNASQRGDRDNSLNKLAAELKNQRKLVKNLQKKSLWSRSMEEVDSLCSFSLECSLLSTILGETQEATISNQHRLGPAGLDLHYANIILQIDSIVARSGNVSSNTRDTLYQSLPPNIKDSLRTKVRSFHVDKELTVTEIQDEMEKTLHWLVRVATNTAKAHHGFGWVGEWAGSGSNLNRRTVETSDIMRIETLHHAGKQKTEAYIIDLLLWLNYLAGANVEGHGGMPLAPETDTRRGQDPSRGDSLRPKEGVQNGRLPVRSAKAGQSTASLEAELRNRRACFESWVVAQGSYAQAHEVPRQKWGP